MCYTKINDNLSKILGSAILIIYNELSSTAVRLAETLSSSMQRRPIDSPISCVNDQSCRQMEDEFDAHVPEKFHKVPNFEHLLNPVLMVTTNPELIKGFRFEFGMPLS